MKSLPTTSPGLPKAAQWAALHECAHSEGCGLCREATSVSSLRKAARTRCLGVSSAGWAGAAESDCTHTAEDVCLSMCLYLCMSALRV